MLVHIATQNSSSSITELDDDCIQPNAIDLRLDRVWSMMGIFLIDEERKIHRQKEEIEVDEEGYYNLKSGDYEISLKGIVKMGPDEAGYVITRSTLNRNGIFITSGLYDSGYEGSMAACLHVQGGMMRIKRDTRVAQFVVTKSQSVSSYDGDYGLGKEMDAHLRSE